MPARAGPSSILRHLFEAAGYRLEDRPLGTLAIRTSDRRGVLIVDGMRSPGELAENFPKDLVHRTLVYPGDPGPVAREIASANGLEVIDDTSLGPALGELLLPGPARLLPPGTVPGPEPLEAPVPLFPAGDRTVRPRVARSDAESLAGVEGWRSTLRLVPFFVAPYRVRVPTAQGTAGPATEHIVAVHGLSGRVEAWEANDREIGPPPEEAGGPLPPLLTEASALARAEAALRRRHTVSVDHTEQHGGAIVIERRRVVPGPEDLRIGPFVLVHVPYWYVEGPEGRVVIDAVTGGRAGTSEPEGADGAGPP
jgi:hypothetical protein